MGAHPDTFERLTRQLVAATDPQVIDELLDLWVDVSSRATEWDAQQWGFKDSWLKVERDELRKRCMSSHLKAKKS